ncbi:MAG: hypothetical protein ACRCUI_14360 [Polymorphobacter sp.]
MKSLLIAAALLAATPALAAPSAASLFQAGKFNDAVAAGTAEATPAALIIAGRAQLQIAAYFTADKAKARSLIAAANSNFDAALAKSPGNAEAMLQKIIAQGYVAKLDQSPGGAKAMKKGLDAFLAAHPENAVAWAVLGGWNGGAVASVGKFVASTMLGANPGAMTKAFDRAMALAPNDPAHPTFNAMTLLDIDDDNGAKAKALLTRAAAMPATDGYTIALKNAGAGVLKLLAGGDNKAAQAAARRAMPFGTLAR